MSTTTTNQTVNSPAGAEADVPPPLEGAASLDELIRLASTPEHEGAPFEPVDYLVLALACLLLPAILVAVAWLA